LDILWSVRRKCLPNFKERKTYICIKIRVDMMKGWNMTVKVKIIKNFIKGIDKKLFEKRKKRLKKKRERM